MTLETLVRIVIETVEEVLAAERLTVLGLAFNKNNEERLQTAVSSVKSDGKVIFFEYGLPDYLPDTLLVDYLPVNIVPEIALGLTSSPFSKFIADMLISGKKIIAIGYDPALPSTAPAQYSALFSSYYKMLAGYGIEFGYCKTPVEKPKASYESNVYEGNVLTKKDLLLNAVNGEISIGKSVIVTDLAFEESMIRNIRIKRRGFYENR